MRNALDDLRYAARVLRRTPALTAVAVLTLALGIAATTAVFGWIDGMVLHPFRGASDDGQLAVLESAHTGGIEAPNVSYSDCRDFQHGIESISGLALTQQAPASVGDGERAYPAWFELVSGNYFDVLGVKPVLGRTFTRDEYGDGTGAFTAVISVGHRRRRRHLAGNSSTDRAYAVPRQSGGPGKHGGRGAVPRRSRRAGKPDSGAAGHQNRPVGSAPSGVT